MSKTLARLAFNAAVVITNNVHGAKRAAQATAIAVADNVTEGVTVSKEAGQAFWAGLKYAHAYNKNEAQRAQHLSAEDVAASKPGKTKATRVVTKARKTSAA